MRLCRAVFTSVTRQVHETTSMGINYEALRIFKQVKGHLRIPRSFVAGKDGDPLWPAKFVDTKIGEMAEGIRRKIRKKSLHPADAMALKKMGFVVDLQKDRIDSLRTAFQLYVERYGNGRVLRSFSISPTDTSWPANVRGTNLGNVLTKIRAGHYPMLHAELRAMGVAVDCQHAPPDFDRNFRALKVYKEIHNSVAVHPDFVIPANDTRYPADARGIKLGLWMRNLRKRGYFAEHRQTLLDFGVNLDYKPFRKTGFEFYYTALVVYKSIHGTVEVPEDFVVPLDDERYPEKSRGMNLGSFVHTVQNGGYIANRQRLLDLGVRMKVPVTKGEAVVVKKENDSVVV